MRMRRLVPFLLMTICAAPSKAQLYVASGDRIFVTSTDELQLQENLENNGTIDYLTLSGGNALSISGTGTITNLKINKSAGTATMTGGMQSLTNVLTLTAGTLAVGGTTTPTYTAGYLTLKSSSTASARIASHAASTGTVTGNVIVERFIDVDNRAKQWRTLGFPFNANMPLSAISGFSIDYTSGTRSMMYFNESGDDGRYTGSSTVRNSGYQSFTASTETISAGAGVMAWLYGNAGGTPGVGSNMTGTLTAIAYGPLFEDGNDVTLPVSYTSANANKGWNLVANPVVYPIDWNNGSNTKTTINNTIYRWNPASASWTTYNGTSGTPTGVDGVIEAGGSFFVQASASSPVLKISQSAKTSSTAGFIHMGRVPRLAVAGERAQIPVRLAGVRLSVQGQGNPMPEEAYVDVSRADATEGFDSPYDAVSMGRSSGAGISVVDEKNDAYAMLFDRPITEAGIEKRYYPLKVTSPAEGPTSLELWTEGAWNPLNSVSLIDRKEGRTLLLRGGRLNYGFDMGALKEEGRFVLAVNHLKVDRESLTPSFEVKLLGNPVSTPVLDLLVSHPNSQAQRWSVLDITGRVIGAGAFGNGSADVQHRLSVPGLRSAGSYLLKVEMENGDEKLLRFVRQ